MPHINLAKKEINCKLIAYGCEMSGKSALVHAIQERAPEGEVTIVRSEEDATLPFEYLQLPLGHVDGMQTKFHLYTVPAQACWDPTHQSVFRGVDGVIFVVDSLRMAANLASLSRLKVNLAKLELDPATTPLVLVYNKRDCRGAYPVETLDLSLNEFQRPSFEVVATEGENVVEALKQITLQVLERCSKEYGLGTRRIPAKKKPKRMGPRRSESARLRKIDAEIKPPAPPKVESPPSELELELDPDGTLVLPVEDALDELAIPGRDRAKPELEPEPVVEVVGVRSFDVVGVQDPPPEKKKGRISRLFSRWLS